MLKELCSVWYDNAVAEFVSLGTLSNYSLHIRYIFDFFGNAKAVDVSRSYAQAFVAFCATKLSPSTVRAIVATLSSIYKYGIENGNLSHSPCSGLKLPPVEMCRGNVFTEEEQLAIERTIAETQDPRDIGALICLYTGLRLGEVCALKWSHIRFSEKLMYVQNSIGRVPVLDKNSKTKTKIVTSTPKTSMSSRVLPLPDFLCNILKEHKLKTTSEYILPNKKDDKLPLQPRTLQNVFRRLLQRAGVNYRNFHSLRHTFVTRVLELGADIKSASELAGHSNVTITLNRYAHSLLRQKRKVMGMLNKYYESKGIENSGNFTQYNTICVNTTAKRYNLASI